MGRIVFSSFALFCLLYSTTALAQWQPDGAALSTAIHDQTVPVSVSDGAGGVIVAWQDFQSGNNWDIYVQRVDASGTALWTTNGVALCTEGANQTDPAIASDGAGGAIVTWYDTRSFPGADLKSIFAQRVDAGGVPQWTANGVSLCTEVNGRGHPMITADGLGGAIVTWEDYRNSSTTADIYTQRVDPSGVVQWTTNGVAVCTAVNDQLGPMIASVGAAGAIITWYDLRNGIDDDIFAQRVDMAGVVQWAPNGLPVCTAANSQYLPTILPDGAGGAIITWEDYRNSNYDIFVQRVNNAGTPLWTPNGVALCTAPGSQGIPMITTDGSGGAIITWYDFRNVTDSDIYAQRVNASGVPQWPPDGAPVCTAPGNQFNPTIVSDNLGGAIVAWRDLQGGTDYDIYSQRLNSYGVVQWPPAGVALCTAAGDQSNPTIVSDGASGAIVAWQDPRLTDYDVYAQEVNAAGIAGARSTGVRDTPSIATLTVLTNDPNPFSTTTEFEIGLPAASDIEVEIYDVAGRRVSTLDVAHAAAGLHEIPFSGLDSKGRALPSGVYFYQVHADNETVARKMVIAR
ncbi:MAG TPA: T9SS type A sorting domain-containing protein [Candidatus Krumholzibacteria bacterium]|nr:T9SS type A sorting domain-containing protein [Candidatus Krumholzibacteria bacterium]